MAFLCLFAVSPEATVTFSVAGPVNGKGRRRGGLRFSAALWSLVSPRDPTKSPDRLAARSLGPREKHWGGREFAGKETSVFPTVLRSREDCGHGIECKTVTVPRSVQSGCVCLAGRSVCVGRSDHGPLYVCGWCEGSGSS